MPLLIFHCRTRLFLALVQQRTLPGGTPTLRFQEEPMNFTLIPHQLSVYFSSIYFEINVNKTFSTIINLIYYWIMLSFVFLEKIFNITGLIYLVNNVDLLKWSFNLCSATVELSSLKKLLIVLNILFGLNMYGNV